LGKLAVAARSSLRKGGSDHPAFVMNPETPATPLLKSTYFTVSVTGSESTVVLSVAVTAMLGYVPGTVAGLRVSCPDPDLVGSAWEVAVMVALVGR
jgi:hypothetical protein